MQGYGDLKILTTRSMILMSKSDRLYTAGFYSLELPIRVCAVQSAARLDLTMLRAVSEDAMSM